MVKALFLRGFEGRGDWHHTYAAIFTKDLSQGMLNILLAYTSAYKVLRPHTLLVKHFLVKPFPSTMLLAPGQPSSKRAKDVQQYRGFHINILDTSEPFRYAEYCKGRVPHGL